MPKKTVTKSKPRTAKTAKPKVTKVTETKKAVLSSVDKFFIQGNYETWTPEQLAVELGKPVELINKEIADYTEGMPTGVSQSFDRPAKGVVCMTPSTSMQSDDLKGSQALITEAHIQKAVEAKDYAMAQKLKEMMETQQRDAHVEQCAKYKNCWHFITPPEVHHARMHGNR